MNAATVYDTAGEERTGVLIGSQVLTWERGEPVLADVAAVLHAEPATTIVHHYRRLCGWLSTRNPTAWPHLLDALDALADNLVPVGPAPATGPVQPTVPRPLAPVRAGWFT